MHSNLVLGLRGPLETPSFARLSVRAKNPKGKAKTTLGTQFFQLIIRVGGGGGGGGGSRAVYIFFTNTLCYAWAWALSFSSILSFSAMKCLTFCNFSPAAHSVQCAQSRDVTDRYPLFLRTITPLLNSGPQTN